LLSKITNNVQEDYQSFDQNFIERAIAEIVFKNIAGFGLWRSINKATASRQVFEEGGETCPRAFVGAVAMGWHGEVIATAYRGENINLAQHAEEILIKKIETLGKLGDVCMVASTLEPCKIRSERHRESLGHTKGCSTLLIESGIKAVVFLQNDPNGHGRGRGAENLQSHEILVLMGNDPAALHSAAVIQIYPHLQNQG
jgi:pyrimidine deaminase RibD-like protein